jgi:hypothetical protein
VIVASWLFLALAAVIVVFNVLAMFGAIRPRPPQQRVSMVPLIAPLLAILAIVCEPARWPLALVGLLDPGTIGITIGVAMEMRRARPR